VSESRLSDKPFAISKWEVQEAYEVVKTNGGAPGVDGCSVEDFEADLKNNLYKIWNRMSSGSYFPPPVKAVAIPKSHGLGTRVLGVRTVADRVAQTVVARRLEQKVEPIFHPGSYGYRPKRSSLDAVGTCRQRCWKTDWVVDLDIRSFFDNVPWDLLVRAVEHHADQPWVVLYLKRWLAVPVQHTDGSRADRDRGTPQGSAVSPVLANLFLHYAFDAWMARQYPTVRFERYVDDAVVHCVSERQARMLQTVIGNRLESVGLQLHPDKTQIVYCQDQRRQGAYAQTSFTFLGYTFRPRAARNRRGETFTGFGPAISKDALNKISRQVRQWRLDRRTGLTLEDLTRWINPIVRGWMQYYGVFNRSAMYPLLQRINAYLVRWLRKKYRRLRRFDRAHKWWRAVTTRCPTLFAHWRWTCLIWS
jgi:group II intron reverse transcriptase/maturase